MVRDPALNAISSAPLTLRQVLRFGSSAFFGYPIAYAPITPLPHQASHVLAAPRPFHRIQILETIGSGASADVYSAPRRRLAGFIRGQARRPLLDSGRESGACARARPVPSSRCDGAPRGPSSPSPTDS